MRICLSPTRSAQRCCASELRASFCALGYGVPGGASMLSPTGTHWQPVGLAFDGQGSLWVIDTHLGRMDLFDARGRWRESWTGLDEPRRIAMNCADRIYVLGGERARAGRFEAGTVEPIASEPQDFESELPAMPVVELARVSSSHHVLLRSLRPARASRSAGRSRRER